MIHFLQQVLLCNCLGSRSGETGWARWSAKRSGVCSVVRGLCGFGDRVRCGLNQSFTVTLLTVPAQAYQRVWGSAMMSLDALCGVSGDRYPGTVYCFLASDRADPGDCRKLETEKCILSPDSSLRPALLNQSFRPAPAVLHALRPLLATRRALHYAFASPMLFWRSIRLPSKRPVRRQQLSL